MSEGFSQAQIFTQFCEQAVRNIETINAQLEECRAMQAFLTERIDELMNKRAKELSVERKATEQLAKLEACAHEFDDAVGFTNAIGHSGTAVIRRCKKCGAQS